VGVTLRRAQPRVAEQFLNRAQIGAGLEQMGRKRVAQRVRADAAGDRRLPHVLANDAIDAPGGETAAAQIQKKRTPGSSVRSHSGV